MRRVARRALALWVLMGLVVGGLAWFCADYTTQGEAWALHGANPHLYAGSPGLAMGTVTDRDGRFLLRLGHHRVYTDQAAVRRATVHWLGDRSGNIRATALQTYADQMAGYDPIAGLYSYTGGGKMTLTLSAHIQAAALAALGDHYGTVAVCNYKTGALLCAVSAPAFDPEEPLTGRQPQGLYLNRFTQGTYVPGSIFKIVTAAAALETDPDLKNMEYTCDGSHRFPGGSVTCESAHGRQNMQDALRHSCNCYFAALSHQLGGQVLQTFAEGCGVLSPVSFDGIATASGNIRCAGAGALETAWSAIGQHKDLVNPCAFLTFLCAVAGGGQGVQPYLVQQVEARGRIAYFASTQQGMPVMSPETAENLTRFLRNNVENGYGQEGIPSGMTLCAKSGTAEVDGKKPHALFAGFVLEERYPLAFIVAVEHAGYGKAVCMPILAQVLSACAEVLE